MKSNDNLLRKTFLRFLLPLIIQYLAFSLSEFTDSILVSQMLGDKAMAAVNLASSFVLIFSTVSITIGTGGSAEYTKFLGEKNPTKANITTPVVMVTPIMIWLVMSFFIAT